MNEFDFARSFLRPYKTKGDEIIPQYCPICHGGDHRDKETFALNYREHIYNCRRGSCDAHGYFTQLCKAFGVEADREEFSTPPVRRTYRRPTVKAAPPTDQVAEYLHLRGFTDTTVRAFDISSSDGSILFPFYRNAEDAENKAPTFIKYRKPQKIEKGERKMWREKDTEPILFGMHLCDSNDPTLYIFEGEFDAMCGYQASGLNCVSVPSGCEDFTWLETCEEWLRRFEVVAVFADNDEAGRKMLSELSRKLDIKVLQPEFSLYCGCKDANEILVKMGATAIKTIMETMKPVAVQGLLNLADVQNVDMADMPRALTGIKALDRMTGGMFYGDLSVWTGKRGEGKSTLLTQLLLNSVNSGINVCIYSGEIPADRLKYGINLQAAGSQYIQTRKDLVVDRTISYVPGEYLKKIQQWYNGKIWVYDNKIIKTDETTEILKIFELAYKRYDCKVFLVDNLMTVNSTAKDRDIMQMQADFTVRLRKLADKLGVHIHLVVHPRKTDGVIKDSDSVSGLGTITNIACNVFNVHRCTEEEQQKLQCGTVVMCLKNRAYGELENVRLDYNPYSKRFVELGEAETLYAWMNEQIYETEREAPPF
ncbi:DnaB-like helicase C-terminal domain-containing protein [Anaerotruncus rubiinfantis]|uniref:DnaB-like helicase C-terminal domain-containing protein n=1 Tax=Anaerotruncus rubiinfantis TaxID=1720200 RepID=UPI0034A387E4